MALSHHDGNSACEQEARQPAPWPHPTHPCLSAHRLAERLPQRIHYPWRCGARRRRPVVAVVVPAQEPRHGAVQGLRQRLAVVAADQRLRGSGGRRGCQAGVVAWQRRRLEWGAA